MHYVGGIDFKLLERWPRLHERTYTQKIKCLMDLSYWQNTFVLLPCQLPRAKSSLFKMIPRFRNKRNIFPLGEILSFHNFIWSIFLLYKQLLLFVCENGPYLSSKFIGITKHLKDNKNYIKIPRPLNEHYCP